jgi:putative DNA primase/helicase
MIYSNDYGAEFRQAMADKGISTNADMIPDGAIHRVHVIGDKNGTRNGYYAFYGDGIPAGFFGSWRLGVQFTWSAKLHSEMTRSDRRMRSIRLQQMRLKHDAERQQRQLKAASWAAILWSKCIGAEQTHPYLVSKGIQPHHLRQQGELLFVPMINAKGELWNLQRIWPDGTKRFMQDGCIKGCFALFGDLSSGPIYVCEGVATGASIHEKSGIPTVCAMNAGNLISVCSALARPDRQIIICADNDHRTDGNPGVTKGREAAAAVGAGLTWPDTCGLSCTCSDFNDVLNCVNASKGAAK